MLNALWHEYARILSCTNGWILESKVFLDVLVWLEACAHTCIMIFVICT